jgi:hypothetical protein
MLSQDTELAWLAGLLEGEGSFSIRLQIGTVSRDFFDLSKIEEDGKIH